MALAVDGGLIAGSPKQFGENLLVPVERVAVVHKPVLVTVLASHDHRTARAADGVGAETVFKHHSLSRQLVNLGRGVHRFQPAVVRANRMGCVVVTKDKEDIRALIFGLRQRNRG